MTLLKFKRLTIHANIEAFYKGKFKEAERTNNIFSLWLQRINGRHYDTRP
ncbi:protein of unknown function [Xenorhabdus poinarii G6]|uniref:Uncharacterized protein n=1 Tax=Xenorhabdus poinarii G6 TaxID=1354304 RepID=A0A068R596_9GAMM|nr:protein of unknown function [Xenorhabdus poinarii G6]